MSGLKLGFIVDDLAQVASLRQAAQAAEQDVACVLLSANCRTQLAEQTVDAWVVNVDADASVEAEAVIDFLFDSVSQPIVFCEGLLPTPVSPDFASWLRRTSGKMRELNGVIVRQQHIGHKLPSSVWVLAGSVGGPEAVRAFLAPLPPNLGIAFVYANHIERDSQEMLLKAMTVNAAYSAYAPTHGGLLRENAIAVISPEVVTRVTKDGSFNVYKHRWDGPFQPNLDQVIASTAVHFGKSGGMIVFSGTCDDAAAASRLMRRCQGLVWTQAGTSCISAAMPDATTAAIGRADFSGTPAELAAALVAWAASRNPPTQRAPALER